MAKCVNTGHKWKDVKCRIYLYLYICLHLHAFAYEEALTSQSLKIKGR
jgi:hypothetical protein